MPAGGLHVYGLTVVFCRKYFAAIRGNMTFIYMWGGALGPVIAGYFYDQPQNYPAVLWSLIATLFVSVRLTGLLIKPRSTKTAEPRADTAPEASR